jgi:hypothetical protein
MGTTLNEIEQLLTDYRAWLKDKTTIRSVEDEWVEITTPYLDRHNDAIQIFARRDNGGYLLTDDGYIIRDLEASGCNLSTDKRRQLLQVTLNGFGVRLRDDSSLEVRTPSEGFPRAKHSLVQAMLAINDLFYLAQPVVESLFLEDVETWLKVNGVRFIPRAKFTGATGFDHMFHFVIPSSGDSPERVVQAINRPSKDMAQQFIHEWTDTQKVRNVESRAYAFLNDHQSVAGGVIEAFRSYDIRPVLWSERVGAVRELAA